MTKLKNHVCQGLNVDLMLCRAAKLSSLYSAEKKYASQSHSNCGKRSLTQWKAIKVKPVLIVSHLQVVFMPLSLHLQPLWKFVWYTCGLKVWEVCFSHSSFSVFHFRNTCSQYASCMARYQSGYEMYEMYRLSNITERKNILPSTNYLIYWIMMNRT